MTRKDTLDFPVDHLSASSITKFIRCPRQWQENYVYKMRSPSNSSLVIGSAVHLGMSRFLMGEDPGNYFADAKASHLEDDGQIIWVESEERSEQIAKKHMYDYERYAKYLEVVATEKEISIDVPGVPIPVVGIVDVVCSNRIIDLKTTKYFNRKVELNREWKLQANVYQLYDPKPAEFHVLTRSKTDPVALPNGSDHQLFVRAPQARDTQRFIYQMYDVMQFYWDRFGEDEYPGNITHPWAGKYCTVENCCQL